MTDRHIETTPNRTIYKYLGIEYISYRVRTSRTRACYVYINAEDRLCQPVEHGWCARNNTRCNGLLVFNDRPARNRGSRNRVWWGRINGGRRYRCSSRLPDSAYTPFYSLPPPVFVVVIVAAVVVAFFDFRRALHPQPSRSDTHTCKNAPPLLCSDRFLRVTFFFYYSYSPRPSPPYALLRIRMSLTHCIDALVVCFVKNNKKKKKPFP